jgi:hypothetical protein
MREDHTNDFMSFVMTPPQQTEAKYEMYRPSVSTMRIVSNGGGQGLGEVPAIYSGGGDQNSWVMPVVIIVVSAMALMTLYAVLSKR